MEGSQDYKKIDNGSFLHVKEPDSQLINSLKDEIDGLKESWDCLSRFVSGYSIQVKSGEASGFIEELQCSLLPKDEEQRGLFRDNRNVRLSWISSSPAKSPDVAHVSLPEELENGLNPDDGNSSSPRVDFSAKMESRNGLRIQEICDDDMPEQDTRKNDNSKVDFDINGCQEQHVSVSDMLFGFECAGNMLLLEDLDLVSEPMLISPAPKAENRVFLQELASEQNNLPEGNADSTLSLAPPNHEFGRISHDSNLSNRYNSSEGLHRNANSPTSVLLTENDSSSLNSTRADDAVQGDLNVDQFKSAESEDLDLRCSSLPSQSGDTTSSDFGYKHQLAGTHKAKDKKIGDDGTPHSSSEGSKLDWEKYPGQKSEEHKWSVINKLLCSYGFPPIHSSTSINQLHSALVDVLDNYNRREQVIQELLEEVDNFRQVDEHNSLCMQKLEAEIDLYKRKLAASEQHTKLASAAAASSYATLQKEYQGIEAANLKLLQRCSQLEHNCRAKERAAQRFQNKILADVEKEEKQRLKERKMYEDMKNKVIKSQRAHGGWLEWNLTRDVRPTQLVKVFEKEKTSLLSELSALRAEVTELCQQLREKENIIISNIAGMNRETSNLYLETTEILCTKMHLENFLQLPSAVDRLLAMNRAIPRLESFVEDVCNAVFHGAENLLSGQFDGITRNPKEVPKILQSLLSTVKELSGFKESIMKLLPSKFQRQHKMSCASIVDILKSLIEQHRSLQSYNRFLTAY